MSFSILGAAGDQDFAVAEPPTDGISALVFNPNADILAAASWDGTVRVYQISGNTAPKIAQYQHSIGPAMPVLDVVWSKDGTKIYSAGTDKRGVIYDATTQQTTQFAQHEEPIRAVRSVTLSNNGVEYLATGSWDKTLRYWDPRQPAEMAKVPLQERVYSMDFAAPYLVVGCADRHIGTIDTRQGHDRITWRDSNLKWQTRVVSCFPALQPETRSLPSQALKPEQAHGFVVGSIEGRIGVMYHDPPTHKEFGFTFRCHRKEFKTGLERAAEISKAQREGKMHEYGAYAVNAAPFNSNSTYATCGSDGNISAWCNYSKSRLKVFEKKPGPVSAAAYNRDSSLFAYAISYDWSLGHMGNQPGAPLSIMIHKCKPEEVRRKAKR